MMQRAYFYVGDAEVGIAASKDFASEVLNLQGLHNSNVTVLRYGLFSVDDARRIIRLSDQSASGEEGKVIIISVERLFHEAQNALLKLFEEPPEATTLILIVPSEGLLLATLRSRLLPLPFDGQQTVSPREAVGVAAEPFVYGTEEEREKILTKLLERTKADKDEEKQTARAEAIVLMEGLLAATYQEWKRTNSEEHRILLSELTTFLPILHERSAPLKLIFEHLLIVLPTFKKVL